MLFGSSMAAAGDSSAPKPYRPVSCVSFIYEWEAFKRNMKDQLANLSFEYYDVSNRNKY